MQLPDSFLMAIIAGLVGGLAAALVTAGGAVFVTVIRMRHERNEAERERTYHANQAQAERLFELGKVREDRKQRRLAETYIQALSVVQVSRVGVQNRVDGKDDMPPLRGKGMALLGAKLAAYGSRETIECFREFSGAFIDAQVAYERIIAADEDGEAAEVASARAKLKQLLGVIEASERRMAALIQAEFASPSLGHLGP